MAKGDTYQRGTRILSPPQTRRLVRAEHRTIPVGRQRGSDAVLSIAGVPLTATDETQHTKFIGITGSGKTTAISSLIEGALARGDRAIIADPDGVYSERFYDPSRGDIIFNPFDARSSKWDLFSEIKDDYDIEDIARSLIPDAPDSHDNEWRGYARTFFTDVTQRLWEISQHHPAAGSTQELHRILTRAPVTELRKLLRETASEAFLDEDAAKMFAGIRAVTSSAVRAFKYISRQEGAAALSVRKWVKQGQTGQGGVLFMPYRAGEIEALRSTIAAWMRLGIFEAMNREEGDQRLWFVVDELGALGRIGGLSDGLTRLRKFGGRVVLGFQSIDQVQAIYGKSDANTILENCGNTLLLRCGTADQGGTSKFASQLIGEREMMRKTISRSYRGLTDLIGAKTVGQQFYTEPAVMSAELEQLPNHQGYLRVSSRPEWMQVAVEKQPSAPRRSVFSRLFSILKRIVSPFLGRAPPKRHAPENSAVAPFNPFNDSVKHLSMDPTPTVNTSENSAAPVEATPEAAPTRVASSAAASPEMVAPNEVIETSKAEHDPIARVIRPRAGVEIHRFADGSRAFERQGRSLNTPHEHAEIIRILVKEAQDLEWKQIRVTGSDRFRSAVWEEAAARGIGVHGYQPTAAQRASLAAKQDAAIASFAAAGDNSIRRAGILDRADSLLNRWAESGRKLSASVVGSFAATSAADRDAAQSLDRQPHLGHSIERKRPSLWRRLLNLGRRVAAEIHAAATWANDDAQGIPNSIEYAEPHARHAARQSHAINTRGDVKRAPSIDHSTLPENTIKDFYAPEDYRHIYFYTGTQTEAFRDEGLRLTTHATDHKVINSLIQIAAARQWKAVTVKGSEEFRREAWLQAARYGIEVGGFRPDQTDYAKLAAALEQDRNTNKQAQAHTPEVHAVSLEKPTTAQPELTSDVTRHFESAASDALSGNAPPAKRKFFNMDEKKRIVQEAAALKKDSAQYQALLQREGVNAGRIEAWGRQIAKADAQKNAPKQTSRETPDIRQRHEVEAPAAESAPTAATAAASGPAFDAEHSQAALEARSSAREYFANDYAHSQSGRAASATDASQVPAPSSSQGRAQDMAA